MKLSELYERLGLATYTKEINDQLIDQFFKKINDKNKQDFINKLNMFVMSPVYSKFVKNVGFEKVLGVNCQSKNIPNICNAYFSATDESPLYGYVMIHTSNSCLEFKELDSIVESTPIQKLNTPQFIRTKLLPYFSYITSSFIHELTHYEQNQKSNGGYYDSYTEKVKDDLERKLADGIADLDYYASPQEIDAFSVGEVSYFIGKIQDFPKSKQLDMLEDFKQKIPSIVKNGYISDEDTKSHELGVKIRERYIKKIYKGIDQYIDKITNR